MTNSREVSVPKIELEFIRELNLGIHPDRPNAGFVSAASGLVLRNGFFYLIADDLNDLAVFQHNSNLPGSLHPMINERLPDDERERKKVKPDFEAITFLDSSKWAPDGALLVWPSGSKPQRRRGVVIPFRDRSLGQAQVFDATELLEGFESEVEDLNIEGITAFNSTLRFYQRGNGARGDNATFDVDLDDVLQSIRSKQPLKKQQTRNFKQWDLGEIESIPLTITDAIRVDSERTLILSAAEASNSTYEDGTILGTELGWILSGVYKRIGRLSLAVKAEGVSVYKTSNGWEAYLVTDTDDRTKPAHLYKIRF